ncbi:MAG: (d)CMP kinase [Caldilineaceae bacterium]
MRTIAALPEENLNDQLAILGRLRPAIITIDGPAAAGKSTVGYHLATVANYLFFDTGIMYRAVTIAALQRNLNPSEPQSMGALAAQIQIDITPAQVDVTAVTATNHFVNVTIDGADVTALLHTADVDRTVSTVSMHPGVRQALSQQQRRIGHYYGSGAAKRAGIIMVGRDIGTVVMPDAPLKIYMDASVAERARRRFCERRRQRKSVRFSDVLDDIMRRDKIDSERDASPLRRADDAIAINTSFMSEAEVVQEILLLATQMLQEKNG